MRRTTAMTWVVLLAAAPTARGEIKLADEFLDANYGYSLRPPLNCQIVRQSSPAQGGTAELVRFIPQEGNWILTVQLTTLPKEVAMPVLLAGLQDELRRKYPGLKVYRAVRRPTAGRSGAVLVAGYTVGNMRWLHQQALIRLAPTQVFTLMLNSPLSTRETTEPLFDAVLRTFKVHASAEDQQALREGMVDGSNLLNRVRVRELADRLVAQTWLNVTLDGKDLGYLHVKERVGRHKGVSGIRIEQRGWLFMPDGSSRQFTGNFFVSDDLNEEAWESVVRTVRPARPPERPVPSYLLSTVDQGVRLADKIVLKFLPEPSERTFSGATGIDLKEKVVAVPPSYLPRTIAELLPRIVPLNKPDYYAFAAYDEQRRGLSTRTLRVLGKDSFRRGLRRIACWKLEDRLGPYAPGSVHYVDENGRLLRLESGELVMQPVPADGVERRYASRRTAAETLLLQLSKPRRPGQR